jgi:hypothetical protein
VWSPAVCGGRAAVPGRAVGCKCVWQPAGLCMVAPAHPRTRARLLSARGVLCTCAFACTIALFCIVAPTSKHPTPSRRPLELPEAPWIRAGLLRFCLSSVLPYQAGETQSRAGQAGAGSGAVVGHGPSAPWPNLRDGRGVLELNSAIKEIEDVPLVGACMGHGCRGVRARRRRQGQGQGPKRTHVLQAQV